jgi:hypothetical protein
VPGGWGHSDTYRHRHFTGVISQNAVEGPPRAQISDAD